MGPSSSTGPVGPLVNHSIGESAHLEPKALAEAVAKLNSTNFSGPENEMVVTISGHRLTIQVVNRDTREIVEQISPPSLFQMYKRLTAYSEPNP